MTAVLAALVNGAILSVPLTMVVWLALGVTPRRVLNAATRHVVWWATLAIAVTLPVVYLPMSPFHSARQATSYRELARIEVAASEAAAPHEESEKTVEAALPADAPESRPLFPVEVAAGPLPRWIVTAWMGTSLLMLFRLSASLVLLERRKARALDAPMNLAGHVEEWLIQCGSIRKRVRLAVSAEIKAPMVSGPYRPSILLPARLLDELGECELSQIGLHEAAHLARSDDYALICQRILEALFALHPVVRWIARRIDLEREIACDDFVVAATGCARPYAACLTRVVELTGGARASLVAVAAAEERSHLATRVEVLLDKSRHTGTHLLKARLAAVGVALAALVCMAARTPGLLAFVTPLEQTIEQASAGIQASPQLVPAQALTPPPALSKPQAPLQAPPQPIPAQPLTPPPALSKPQVSTATPQATRGADRELDARLNMTLVLISVAVIDPLNRFVTGLDKNTFRLFEDGVEQKITQFGSEDAPLSIGLVFDTSGSMGNKLTKSREAVSQFFKTANPADEFFLLQFNDRPELVEDFTTNIENIQNRLTFTQSKGRTALLDAVYMALHKMKKAHNPRKALLIISDGGDNSSRYTESEIKNLVREADVQIYAIGIFEPVSSRGRTAEEMNGPGLLIEIAEQTGGRHFALENLNELPDVAAKIGIELRNQYILGYSPSNKARDGKFRKVHVELEQPRGLPPLTAIFQVGYYAPAQ
jgi:Ca-activated chloride channel family protein